MVQLHNQESKILTVSQQLPGCGGTLRQESDWLELPHLSAPHVMRGSSSQGLQVTLLQEDGGIHEEPVMDAGLSLCAAAARIVSSPAGQPPGPATRQLAMAALGRVAAAWGAQRPAPLLAALPPLLGAMGAAGPRALRASALAAVAGVTAALGTRAMPALPQVMPAVLQAAGDALFRLPVPGTGEATGSFSCCTRSLICCSSVNGLCDGSVCGTAAKRSGM